MCNFYFTLKNIIYNYIYQMKIKSKKIPIYYGVLNVVVSKDFKKSLKKLKIKYHKDFTPNDYLAFVVTKKHNIYVFVSPKAESHIIAHEAVHVVNEVFKNTHVKLDVYNDEAQAYLTGWVVKFVSKVLL